MATLIGKCQNCSDGRTSATCTTSTLLIVGNRWWDVTHSYTQQTSDVDSHFHSGSNREDINAFIASILIVMEQILKPPLMVSGLGALDLRGVFSCSKRIRVFEWGCRIRE